MELFSIRIQRTFQLVSTRKNGLNDGMEGVTAARGRKGSITKDFLSWGILFL